MENLLFEDVSRIIEMAWEDRTPFEAIKNQFGLSENDVKQLMRNQLKNSSWLMWRERVTGRKTKHARLQQTEHKFKCSLQKSISYNKISKR